MEELSVSLLCMSGFQIKINNSGLFFFPGCFPTALLTDSVDQACHSKNSNLSAAPDNQQALRSDASSEGKTAYDPTENLTLHSVKIQQILTFKVNIFIPALKG